MIDRPCILAGLKETKENSPLSFDLLSKSYLSKQPVFLIRLPQHQRLSKPNLLRNKHHLRGRESTLATCFIYFEVQLCSSYRATTIIHKDLHLQHLCMRTISSAKGPGPSPWVTGLCLPHRLLVLDSQCILLMTIWVLQVSKFYNFQ